MSRAVNYFVAKQTANEPELSEIIQLSAAYSPVLVGSIEGWKGKSFWIDNVNWKEAFNTLTRQQAEILMGAKEDIIREIRGVRGGYEAVVTDDLDTYPVGTFPGYQLADIHDDLTDGGMSIAEQMTLARGQLQTIITTLEAQGATQDGLLDGLGQVLLLLAA